MFSFCRIYFCFYLRKVAYILRFMALLVSKRRAGTLVLAFLTVLVVDKSRRASLRAFGSRRSESDLFSRKSWS